MGRQLEKLGSLHQKAIRLRIEGRTSQEIADACGVRLQTIYEWFGDPLIKAEVQRQLARINDIFAERMAGLGVAAMEALLDIVRTQPTGELTYSKQLEVIREILDRTGNTKPEEQAAQQLAPANAFEFNFSQPAPSKPPGEMSDQELLAVARQLSGQVVELEEKTGA